MIFLQSISLNKTQSIAIWILNSLQYTKNINEEIMLEKPSEITQTSGVPFTSLLYFKLNTELIHTFDKFGDGADFLFVAGSPSLANFRLRFMVAAYPDSISVDSTIILNSLFPITLNKCDFVWTRKVLSSPSKQNDN